MSKWILPVVLSFVFVLTLMFFYWALYHFEDGSESGQLTQNDLFYSWQNRNIAKFLSLLTANSRIYKGFIFYDTWKNPTNRPVLGDWKGLKVAVVGGGAIKGGNIYQGVSSDTFNIRAIPKSWDRSGGLLVVSVDGSNLTLRTDRSTLVYEMSVGSNKALFGRGSRPGEEFMRGDVLQLSVVDEGQHPLILDGLVLLP